MRIALAVVLVALATGAGARDRALILEWQVLAGAKPLERELVVTLKDAKGAPVEGVTVEIAVDMPSMPMMHRVPTVHAKPAGAAGRYAAKVEVEMPGEWAARITVSRPHRGSWVRKFQVAQ